MVILSMPDVLAGMCDTNVKCAVDRG